MSDLSPEAQFQSAMERYAQGESAATLLPTFVGLCRQFPKNEVYLTCLSWLYLLEGKPDLALNPAQQAVRLSPLSAQSRLNVVLAMLESGKKGVRPEVDRVQQIVLRDPDQRDEVVTNLEEGSRRRPDWPALIRVREWLSL
ncbi:MAG: tetratricopeptide repeat protein [Synechococcales cyanobacterium]